MVYSSLEDFANSPYWVAWRNVEIKGEKKKIPYTMRQPTSHHNRIYDNAKVNDPSTWLSMADAFELHRNMVNGTGGGVGIMLGIETGRDERLGGIDLDT